MRLVQDGPLVDGFGAALRVDGLVVGDGALGVRLGYHRNRITGPWLLRVLFERFEHRTRYVAWAQIDTIDRESIRLVCRAADLTLVREIA